MQRQPDYLLGCGIRDLKLGLVTPGSLGLLQPMANPQTNNIRRHNPRNIARNLRKKEYHGSENTSPLFAVIMAWNTGAVTL